MNIAKGILGLDQRRKGNAMRKRIFVVLVLTFVLLIIAVVPVFAVPEGAVGAYPPNCGEPATGGAPTDRNGDGFVCMVIVGAGGLRIGFKLEVDNNLPPD